MPVWPNNRAIIISHPIYGKGLEPERLGHMSTELCQWLKYKLDEQTAIDADETDALGFKQFFTQPTINAFTTRSLISAIRGYSPSLCYENGRLTNRGIETAKIARAIIMDKENLGAHDILDLTKITRTEDLFITGEVTIRQAALLKMIYNAVLDAEANDRRELDKEYQALLQGNNQQRNEITQTQQMALLAKNNQDSTNGTDYTNSRESAKDTTEIEGDLTDIFRVSERTNETQPLQAITFNLGAGQRRQGYVPTAIFVQKTRNDLRNLVKYGLVDLRAHVQGVRGRPKHVVRASPTGVIMVADLVRQDVI